MCMALGFTTSAVGQVHYQRVVGAVEGDNTLMLSIDAKGVVDLYIPAFRKDAGRYRWSLTSTQLQHLNDLLGAESLGQLSSHQIKRLEYQQRQRKAGRGEVFAVSERDVIQLQYVKSQWQFKDLMPVKPFFKGTPLDSMMEVQTYLESLVRHPDREKVEDAL